MSFGKPATSGILQRLPWASLSLGGLLMLPGCSGSASQEELGEIHYYLPPIDGMETRYYLPPMLQAKSKQYSENQQEQSSEATPTTEPKGNSNEAVEEPAPTNSPPAADDTVAPKAEAEATALPPEPADEPESAQEKITAPESVGQ